MLRQMLLIPRLSESYSGLYAQPVSLKQKRMEHNRHHPFVYLFPITTYYLLLINYYESGLPPVTPMHSPVM